MENTAQMIQSLLEAVKMLSAVPKYTHPTVRWAVPTYSKCGDLLSASDYCDSLARYQKALGFDDQEVLGHVVAIALTDTATSRTPCSNPRGVLRGLPAQISSC